MGRYDYGMYAGCLGQIHDFDDLTVPYVFIRLQNESDDTLSTDNVLKILAQRFLVDFTAFKVDLARPIQHEGHLVLDLIEERERGEDD